MRQTSLFTTKYVTFHVTVRVPIRRGSNIASLTTPSIPCGRSMPGSRHAASHETRNAGKSLPRVHSRDFETAESVRRMTHRHSPACKKRATRFDTHNKYVTLVQASAKHTSRARGRTPGCSNNTVKLLHRTLRYESVTSTPAWFRRIWLRRSASRITVYVHTYMCTRMTRWRQVMPLMILLSFARNFSTFCANVICVPSALFFLYMCIILYPLSFFYRMELMSLTWMNSFFTSFNPILIPDVFVSLSVLLIPAICITFSHLALSVFSY